MELLLLLQYAHALMLKFVNATSNNQKHHIGHKSKIFM